MKLFEILKQPTDKTCQQTCLAMITGTSVEYVISWFGDWGRDAKLAEDAIIFLAHHGIYLATFLEAKKGKTLDIEKNTIAKIDFTMEDRPALLVVKSERWEGKLHAVLWDGQQVLDPSVGKKRELKEFEIIEYWPLLFTDQQYQRIKEAL